MGNVKIRQDGVKEVHYYPCVKCGSDDIEFDSAGYSAFNVGWGKCKNCGHKIYVNNCGDSVEEFIKAWNDVNNPLILRMRYQKQIEDLQKLIDALPEIKIPEGGKEQLER